MANVTVQDVRSAKPEELEGKIKRYCDENPLGSLASVFAEDFDNLIPVFKAASKAVPHLVSKEVTSCAIKACSDSAKNPTDVIHAALYANSYTSIDTLAQEDIVGYVKNANLEECKNLFSALIEKQPKYITESTLPTMLTAIGDVDFVRGGLSQVYGERAEDIIRQYQPNPSPSQDSVARVAGDSQDHSASK